MTAPLFYVDSVPGSGHVSIEGSDARHAVGALRLQVGEQVFLSDGMGTVADSTVTAADRRGRLDLAVLATRHEPEPRSLTVFQAIPKGDRADLAVELLTEAGVSRIVPWPSQRTVAKWAGKSDAKRDRWQRVARAAAMQSRRAYLPVVDPPASPTVSGTCLVLHERATASLFRFSPPPGPLTVVVGPEGGLADEEVEVLTGQGAVAVHLGTLIMRTSTAGAAACVWLRGLEQSVES